MVFAWKSFVSDGVVIAEDINDAANKMKARQGINAEEGRSKLWEYCLRFGGGVSENIVDYTLVRFTDPVPDERGMEFMKERYSS